MSKVRKSVLISIVQELANVNESIISEKSIDINSFSEFQQNAIEIGEYIENTYTDCDISPVIGALEEYCECLFQLSQAYGVDKKTTDNITKKIRKLLNNLKNDIEYKLPKDKPLVVFFPYKAAMWDSLESIYLAAKADDRVEAIVVPIPYYDRNPDGSFGVMHYEGMDLPEGIEIIDWESYDLSTEKPDIAYIHNPYDDCNHVTSVHPKFYSYNLKKDVGTLIYCPYFATSGSLGESWGMAPCFTHVDYILVQAPYFADVIDKSIPKDKIITFGSPKFDRVINMCKNPPEPPAEWVPMMAGKKAYFYNTSISGALANTVVFLKKMEYVFNTFIDNPQACLIWRPHPLLDSTFSSMRPEFKGVYNSLKRQFVERKIGILDTNPDIEYTISLCDAYIGDAGTSVTSLFGMAAKPLFIFDNRINELPDDMLWKNAFVPLYPYEINKNENYTLMYNRLYVADCDMNFRYLATLDERYRGGWSYHGAHKIGDKYYGVGFDYPIITEVLPDSTVWNYELEDPRGGAGLNFYNSVTYKNYIYLIPFRYPALARFDVDTKEVLYLPNVQNYCVGKNATGDDVFGGIAVSEKNGKIYIASATDNHCIVLDADTMDAEVLEINANNCNGTAYLQWEDKGSDILWMLPQIGSIVHRWNTLTGEVQEFDLTYPEFMCIDRYRRCIVEMRPYNSVAVCDEYAYFTPEYGNKYIKLNLDTKEVSEWQLPYEENMYAEGYKVSPVMWNTIYNSIFYPNHPYYDDGDFRMVSASERKIYKVNLKENICMEVQYSVDKSEIMDALAGFNDEEKGLRYCCLENAFNTLEDFIKDNITGPKFNVDDCRKSYSRISATIDGSCGQKVHEFVYNQKYGDK